MKWAVSLLCEAAFLSGHHIAAPMRPFDTAL